MYNIIIKIRNKIGLFLYKNVLKHIFFMFPPEFMHDSFTFKGKLLGSNFVTRGLVHMMFNYSNKRLEQDILGITFKNPIGLCAGFDKDAKLTQILACVGFGFEEVGSITKNPYEGNKGTRLWRLKKSKSLVVYYGLKNKGANYLYSKLKKMSFKFPIGISIAKTNCKQTIDEKIGIDDYVYTYKKFHDVGDYFTINISCPNAYGGEPYTDSKSLDKLLFKISKVKKTKPIFLKMPADLPKIEVNRLISVAKKYKIDGFIATNLTKDRSYVLDKNIPKVGGISGKAVQELSDNMISYLYKKTKREFVIIGCGGIFNAADAYRKIKNGASLLQMITGMIYEGPFVISEINRGLVELLEKDGYKNISEAVGKGCE